MLTHLLLLSYAHSPVTPLLCERTNVISLTYYSSYAHSLLYVVRSPHLSAHSLLLSLANELTISLIISLLSLRSFVRSRLPHLLLITSLLFYSFTYHLLAHSLTRFARSFVLGRFAPSLTASVTMEWDEEDEERRFKIEQWFRERDQLKE